MGGLKSALAVGDPCCGGAEGTLLSAADPDNDTDTAACELLANTYENDWSRNVDGPGTEILKVQGVGTSGDLHRSIYHLDPNDQDALDENGRPPLGACGAMDQGSHLTNYARAPQNVVPAFTDAGTCDASSIETLIQLAPINVQPEDVGDWSWSGGVGWNGCVSRFEGGCIAYNKPNVNGLDLGLMVADLGCPFTHPVCCQCCSGSEGQAGTLSAKCVKDNNQVPDSDEATLGIVHATATTPTTQGEITLPYYDATNAAAAGFPNQIAEFYMDSMSADGTCGQSCGISQVPSVLLPRNARCISATTDIPATAPTNTPTEEPGNCWAAGRRALEHSIQDMDMQDGGDFLEMDFSEMETITAGQQLLNLELGNEKQCALYCGG